MGLNLKNDIIFKAFFGRKGNEKYLKDFLESMLKIEINKIEVQDEVSVEKLFQEEKGGRLDLVATLNDGIKVNIEMQVRPKKDFIERTLIYSSKIIAREEGKGLRYNKLKKVIMINILDFKLFKETEDYINESVIVLKNHREREIMDNQKWYFIELPKFRKQNIDIEDRLQQWLLFIDDVNKGGIKMAENKSKVLKEARKEVTYLTGDEEIKRLAELREKWEMERIWDEELARKERNRAGNRTRNRARNCQAEKNKKRIK